MNIHWLLCGASSGKTKMAPQTGKKKRDLGLQRPFKEFWSVLLCICISNDWFMNWFSFHRWGDAAEAAWEPQTRGKFLHFSWSSMFTVPSSHVQIFAAVFSLCYFPLNIHFSLFVFRFYFIQRCKNIELFVYRQRLISKVNIFLFVHLFFPSTSQVKQIMEEAVMKKFIHADSSTITSVCGEYKL